MKVNSTPELPAPTVMPPREKGQLRFGQMNAHNFFDTKDDAGKQDPVATRAEYRHSVSKLAHAIRDGLGTPDVITMQEVENLDVLRDLVKHKAIRDLEYKPLMVEGTDPRGIDNAILYRPSAVTLQQFLTIDPVQINENGNNARLYTRPPLIATFGINGREKAKEGVRAVTVIANHFTSKLGGESAAAKRGEQARSLARFVEGLQSLDPDHGVVVAGDLNMTRDEPEFAPLADTKRGAALADATKKIPNDERYTWRRGREHLQLDHVLVSKNIVPHIEVAAIPHIATQIAKGAASDPVRAEGYSDHDPVVVTFTG